MLSWLYTGRLLNSVNYLTAKRLGSHHGSDFATPTSDVTLHPGAPSELTIERLSRMATTLRRCQLIANMVLLLACCIAEKNHPSWAKLRLRAQALCCFQRWRVSSAPGRSCFGEWHPGIWRRSGMAPQPQALPHAHSCCEFSHCLPSITGCVMPPVKEVEGLGDGSAGPVLAVMNSWLGFPVPT